MHKNWLIRTKSNHILGPVSKDKIIELLANGSIKSEDEICSGNGYWFFLREKELLDKYLTSGQTQSFNPISEAKDVLTASGAVEATEVKDDITMVGGINLAALKQESFSARNEKELPSTKGGGLVLDIQEAKLPSAADLEEPDMDDIAPAVNPIEPKPATTVLKELKPPPVTKAAPTVTHTKAAVAPPAHQELPTPSAPGKVVKKKTLQAPVEQVTVKKSLFDGLALYITIVVAIVVMVALYFRKDILRTIMGASWLIMPEAQAQTLEAGKKKAF